MTLDMDRAFLRSDRVWPPWPAAAEDCVVWSMAMDGLLACETDVADGVEPEDVVGVFMVTDTWMLILSPLAEDVVDMVGEIVGDTFPWSTRDEEVPDKKTTNSQNSQKIQKFTQNKSQRQ